ncbi:hypothetical protein LTR56_024252 [Elasticomyces elasticus]|nr:hypothetical protein LTR56_024252 [Elasticomyces elasticus]KAK3639674.1 hypothetical protein LTR22_017347 [Elasticomyces elasticus]KAK4913452.1 hypothetical protein LTR49_018248 [Elasticomyces elasticus]KAK5760978.1 hypothetical protein LTS12_008826 [Elasticomyces elasticus]
MPACNWRRSIDDAVALVSFLRCGEKSYETLRAGSSTLHSLYHAAGGHHHSTLSRSWQTGRSGEFGRSNKAAGGQHSLDYEAGTVISGYDSSGLDFAQCAGQKSRTALHGSSRSPYPDHELYQFENAAGCGQDHLEERPLPKDFSIRWCDTEANKAKEAKTQDSRADRMLYCGLRLAFDNWDEHRPNTSSVCIGDTGDTAGGLDRGVTYFQSFSTTLDRRMSTLTNMLGRATLRWQGPSAMMLGLLLRVSSAHALPTGQASPSRELTGVARSTDGSIVPLPLVLGCIGAASVYDALTARRLLQARLNTWLILAGVLGLVWCVLRMSGEEATYALPAAFTAWLAAWTSLIASCARLLQQRTVFVLLSIFLGGGAPVLTLALLPRADAVTPGSPVLTARETIDIAGPLIATAWTLVVYFMQRLCRY